MFRNDLGNTIVSDDEGLMGTFNRDGNFSFDTGSHRFVHLRPTTRALRQRAGSRRFDDSCKWADDAGGISDMAPAGRAGSKRVDTGVQSVKFNLPNTGNGKVSAFTLDFRGNALFDDDGDGVANEPCLPQRQLDVSGRRHGNVENGCMQ